MGQARFLVVRLGSMGDVVHALPAVHALRAAHPNARIDWLIESRWSELLFGDRDINEVITFDRASWPGMLMTIRRLRAASYSAAIDFQGLYKSAILSRLSGASERIGFDRRHAREGGAAILYTRRVAPRGEHVIEHNLSLVEAAGALRVSKGAFCFPLGSHADAAAQVQQQLRARGASAYFVLNPGGGWGSKCWPAERFGHLHRRLVGMPEFAGLRGVVNFGPGERKLAEAVRLVAGEPEPLLLSLSLPQMIELIRGATFFVGGDTGPMHLAVALGVPVVALFGPTDPARNGPANSQDIVVRNAGPTETSYKRERSPASSMLSITVEQVLGAVVRRMGARS
jgi:lipopolysaccharide heptosyltransferase I